MGRFRSITAFIFVQIYNALDLKQILGAINKLQEHYNTKLLQNICITKIDIKDQATDIPSFFL